LNVRVNVVIKCSEFPYRRCILYAVLYIYNVYENTVEFMIVILTQLASELFCQPINAQWEEVSLLNHKVAK